MKINSFLSFNTLILSLIIILAAFLRFWSLGQNPPGLSWDEASWGYNAYSLGIDGKDEFGKFLPLTYLESFGDFKPPVYAYLDVIPVKVLGLNEFSTRFPSALFGVLTVLLTYFLTKRIFFNSKLKTQYALVATFIIAISPWHIMLSKAAFEANVATFFIVLGVLAFLTAVFEKPWFFVLSSVSFVLSLYTFNTSRVVSPLLVLVLIIFFWRKLVLYKKHFFLACIIGLLIALPVLKFFMSPQASLRFREVNIFSDSGPIETSNREVANDNNVSWSKIIHNRRAIFAVDFLKHYFDNLNPLFLFIRGDGNPKFSTQDVGEMYLWDLPFFLVGILLLFKKKEGNWSLIPIWLLLGVIPAAVARETPHALRIETTLPTFQIIVAYGFINLVTNIRYRVLFLFILAFNFLYFYHGYTTHYAREFSGEWQYGYKDSIRYVSSAERKYTQINVTDYLGRPYIYYLFYKKVDPREFRKTAKVQRDTFGFVNVLGFGKYRFAKDLNKVSKGGSELFIDIPENVPNKTHILKTFYLLNGNPALVAYEK